MFEGISVEKHHVLATELSSAECVDRLSSEVQPSAPLLVDALIGTRSSRPLIGRLSSTGFRVRQATGYRATSYVWATGIFRQDPDATRVDLVLRTEPPMGNLKALPVVFILMGILCWVVALLPGNQNTAYRVLFFFGPLGMLLLSVPAFQVPRAASQSQRAFLLHALEDLLDAREPSTGT